jgi:hypothetical protein
VPKRRFDLGAHFFDLVEACHVRDAGDRAPTRRFDLATYALERDGIATVKRDSRATRREGARDRRADSA